MDRIKELEQELRDMIHEGDYSNAAYRFLLGEMDAAEGRRIDDRLAESASYRRGYETERTKNP